MWLYSHSLRCPTSYLILGMARILPEVSRTFAEYLLLPGLTRKDHVPRNTSLSTPVAVFQRGAESRFHLNIPVVSASMQSVSGPDLAIALARQGGKWGVLDTQGRALTAFQYDELDVVDHQTLRGRQGERTVNLRFNGQEIQP